MDRRDLLRALAGVAALPFIPSSADAAVAFGEGLHRRLTSSSATDFRTLNPQQAALLTQLCDRILPATDTPGALDVKVPEFIDLLLTERADDGERNTFLQGLTDIETKARADGGADFVQLPEEKKLALMRTLDAARNEPGAGTAFGRIKGVTVFAYFTSERVTKEVLKTRMYFRVYEGCAPITA